MLHSATATIGAFASARYCCATFSASELAHAFLAKWFAVMGNAVAVSTKRDAIRDIISQIWMIVPFLDVMGMKGNSVAAPLASVIVALEYLPSPTFVLPGASAWAIPVWIFATGFVAAVLGAILVFVASLLGKWLLAIFTDQSGGGTRVASAIGTGDDTIGGTGRESLPAHDASQGSTVLAVNRPRMKYPKWLSTFLTNAGELEIAWGGNMIYRRPVYAIPAGAPIARNWLSAFWARFPFVWHIEIITHYMEIVKRLAGMGLEPRLLDG